MPIYYNEQEYYQLLSVSEAESSVVMPNEFFDDTSKIVEKIHISKSSKHVSFSFGYLYLTTYLYRYAKFHDHKDYMFNEDELKRLLTISPTNKGKHSVNSIIKRSGVLEELGYIEKVRDYPISYDYDPEEKEFVFSYISDVIADLGESAHKYFNINSKNRRVNLPLKMFNDREIKAIDMECSGTLYDVTYTTSIDIKVFIYCMVRDKLGIEAFYLYSFIKYKNGANKGLWRRNLDGMIKDTGLSESVVKSRLKEMEECKMIFCTHEDFVVKSDEEKRQPNGYSVQSYELFSKNDADKISYKRGRIISPVE